MKKRNETCGCSDNEDRRRGSRIKCLIMEETQEKGFRFVKRRNSQVEILINVAICFGCDGMGRKTASDHITGSRQGGAGGKKYFSKLCLIRIQ